MYEGFGSSRTSGISWCFSNDDDYDNDDDNVDNDNCEHL